MCTLAATYSEVVALTKNLLADLDDERAAVLAGNAIRVYGLEV